MLTGAGMSVESGLPTFRGANAFEPPREGSGRPLRFEELASPQGFARDPALVWSWYNARIAAYAGARPNAGHEALAQMEALYEHFLLATQNVDSLHRRAGSRNVVELHGDLREARCSKCGHRTVIAQNGLPVEEIEHRCGGRMRPNVVWFGEMLPAQAWERAQAAAASADVVLVVGTSAQVYPAASLVTLSGRAYVIEINPDESAVAGAVDAALRESAAHALPRIVRSLAVGRPNARIRWH